MKRGRFFAVALAAVASATACGGSADDSEGQKGSCTTGPCGGDLVGTWTAKEACVSGGYTDTIAGCDSVAVTVSDFVVGGTLTFNADGTWSEALQESLSAHEAFPATCLTATECAQHESSLAAQPGTTSATCKFGGACDCDYESTVEPGKSGSFQTSGSSVTFTGSGQADTESYCVSGNDLTLHFGLNELTVSMLFERM